VERRSGVDRRSGRGRRCADPWQLIGRPGFDLRRGIERRSGGDRAAERAAGAPRRRAALVRDRDSVPDHRRLRRPGTSVHTHPEGRLPGRPPRVTRRCGAPGAARASTSRWFGR